MYKIAKNMISKGKDIYWDQTNLTVKTRKRKLSLLGLSNVDFKFDFEGTKVTSS